MIRAVTAGTTSAGNGRPLSCACWVSLLFSGRRRPPPVSAVAGQTKLTSATAIQMARFMRIPSLKGLYQYNQTYSLPKVCVNTNFSTLNQRRAQQDVPHLELT